LLGYAIRFVENEETARDIIQECFLKFWDKRDLLEAVSVTALLFAMVRNSCLNYLKHLAVVEKHQIEYLASIEGEERLYYADFVLNADSSLLYNELQEQIKIVIDNLPERCRNVFLLSRFEGLKNREIADMLEISTTAVEKHIAKALQRFSRHFKDKYPVDIYITVLAWLIANSK
jgi:RNA polymerase sigma-70 factor (family 1)